MPRDACGDRLSERFLDVGAATLRVTRCFQFSQVVLLQSCRTTPRCHDPHPQPQQPGSGCSAPARPAEYAIRTSRRFGRETGSVTRILEQIHPIVTGPRNEPTQRERLIRRARTCRTPYPWAEMPGAQQTGWCWE
jgi:hypothetical protein